MDEQKEDQITLEELIETEVGEKSPRSVSWTVFG